MFTGESWGGVIATWSYANTPSNEQFWFSFGNGWRASIFEPRQTWRSRHYVSFVFPMLQPEIRIALWFRRWLNTVQKKKRGLRTFTYAYALLHSIAEPVARVASGDTLRNIWTTRRGAARRGFEPICNRKGLVHFAREIRWRRLILFACTIQHKTLKPRRVYSFRL